MASKSEEDAAWVAWILGKLTHPVIEYEEFEFIEANPAEGTMTFQVGERAFKMTLEVTAIYV